MAEKIYLDTTQLEGIANGLKTKSTTISDEFTNSCYSALQMCNSCLEITGLDTTKFFDSFKTIYTNIGTRCNNLSSFITQTIIPSYNEVSNAITKNFNTELGEKIASIVGIAAGTGSALGVSENPTASQGAQTADEEKPTEEKPTEEKPAEEKPIEEKPTEEKPVDEKPATETSKPVAKEEPTKSVSTASSNNVETETPVEVTEEPQQEVVEASPLEVSETPADTVAESPMLSEATGTLEEIVPLEATETLLASDLSGSTVKKGLGIGLGLAGAAAAAGVTSYTINSNNKKDELERDRSREKVDSKTFLERENMAI